jgi:hypothetical protein
MGAPQHDFTNYPTTRPPFGAQPSQHAPAQAAQQSPGLPQRYQPAHNQGHPGAAGAGFRQPQNGFNAPARHPEPRQPDPGFAQPAREPDPMTAGYEQWNLVTGQPDQRGYDLGHYMPSGASGDMADLHDAAFHGDPMHDPLQQQAAWAMPGAGYDDPMHDPAFHVGQPGFEHAQSGALEQAYSEEAVEYEVEEPRRGSWAMRIAGAIVVAIGLGYGLAQGYKLVAGSAPEGSTPVVESDAEPAKTKPLDPGGKQFAHADSKVMGRLGEAPPAADDADAEGGPRKVTTLVVGRDGSIQPPEAPAESAPPAEPGGDANVAVPGVTMFDGFGGQSPHPAPVTASATPQDTPRQQPAAARQPVVVRPPPPDAPRVITASTNPSPPAESHPAPTRTAMAPPQKPAAPRPSPSAGAATPDGSNGYVVVLASVPASGSSRLVALKKFADMQQQYGSVLQNKTPDVREANLGQKGTYHRLLVGPPGSRAQASALCGELKQAGYKDCWVTAY